MIRKIGQYTIFLGGALILAGLMTASYVVTSALILGIAIWWGLRKIHRSRFKRDESLNLGERSWGRYWYFTIFLRFLSRLIIVFGMLFICYYLFFVTVPDGPVVMQRALSTIHEMLTGGTAILPPPIRDEFYMTIDVGNLQSGSFVVRESIVPDKQRASNSQLMHNSE